MSKLAKMVAISGIYKNGHVTLDKEYFSNGSVKVIVTFLDDNVISNEKRQTLDDFSFGASRKDLANFKGSFSDDVIEERRSEQ